MDARPRFDNECAERDFSLLSADTIAQVRRLCRHPQTAEDILHQRLLLGCVALEEHETDKRWQLWELLLTAWRCCQDELDAERHRIEAAEIEALRTDPERRAMRRRLAALNYRNNQLFLHSTSGQQEPLHNLESGSVPEPESERRNTNDDQATGGNKQRRFSDRSGRLHCLPEATGRSRAR